MSHAETLAFKTQIKGLVQGVGFRPFIYRLAAELDVRGTVENRNDGVIIQYQCEEMLKNEFLEKIIAGAPVGSEIHALTTDRLAASDHRAFDGFHIVTSADVSREITGISPDMGVCPDCLADMKHQEHRLMYPFVNCIHCGPRFSIIRDLPYDRAKTTMQHFDMCETCAAEYSDVFDRRFHAQPIACNRCGPSYTLHHDQGMSGDFEDILNRVASLIDSGKTVAVKGLGGFHLACDALNPSAVSCLRDIKKRDGKPFAVMFSHINYVKRVAVLNRTEAAALQSCQRPIVVVQQKAPFPEEVTAGLDTLGAMLPYLPFHALLFEKLTTQAIVLTSANPSGQPLVTDNDQAQWFFSSLADGILTHNRPIFNRVDDSVQMVVNHKIRPIRRSRGYVPGPVRLSLDVDGIIATGAELSNCFCVGKNADAYLSQHIGDLRNHETHEFFIETLDRFKHLLRVEPSEFVCDLHPDYLATRYAENQPLPVTKVQHHHAHIAACMAEHGLDEKVIGVAFDGTGLGTDGNIWGSEFFVCDLLSFERACHFEYVPMPGGERAAMEPYRMGLSYLYQVFGDEVFNLDLDFLRQMSAPVRGILVSAVKNRVNSPLCSSAGRLFDAVAAITGVCGIASYHGEAPMRLESLIDHTCAGRYDWQDGPVIRFEPMIRQIVDDNRQGVSNAVISAKFHNTLVAVVSSTVERIRYEHGMTKVVLSGGVFQNRTLLGRLENSLARRGFQVYAHERVPTNDGGIALGQLIICAKKREMTCV